MAPTVLLSLIPLYVLYILGIGVLMFRRRSQAVREGKVDIKYFKSYSLPAPPDLEVIKNHYSNQFEVPMIFFITILAALQTEATHWGMVACGGLFFISRIWHSWIHLGTNRVLARARAYFAGVFLLLAMWTLILVHFTR